MDQQFINIKTMTVRDLGDAAITRGVPPSLDDMTFADFVRVANELGVDPTSLLLKLAPQCGS